MRKQFKETIIDINDEKIVLILGDVSVYLFDDFKIKNPNKVFNLAIGENSLVSVSAGLSSQGLIPFVHTINPFLSDRSYEQIKLDKDEVEDENLIKIDIEGSEYEILQDNYRRIGPN